jgi:hypothetical protein
MGEKAQVFSWFMFVVLLTVILTVVGWALWPVEKMVERQVMINSYQYKAGMQDQIAILQASLAEVETRLASDNLDKVTRDNLLAQKATINVQLQAALMRR